MSLYKWIVGIVLTVVMVSVLASSAILFSARDFQYGLRDIVPNGLVQVDRMLAIQDQLAELEARVEEPRGQQLALEQQVASFDAELAALDESINTTRGEIAAQLAEIETAAQVQSNTADADSVALSARAAALAARPNLPAQDQQKLATLRGRLDQLAEQEQNRALRYSERTSVAAQAENISRQVAEQRSGALALQTSVVPDASMYERVRGEVMALQNLSPYGISAYLAQGHPALLSTVLVLLMGALGSLLYLFPAYLNRPQPVTLEEIAVRVIFGMCAALAFYVLANATVAGFSIGAGVAQANTASTLNPFTVSLIGIVAGVLAEDIAKWIQDRGRGIFTQGAYTPTSDAAASPPPAASSGGDVPGGGLVNNQAIS
ncbi:MAG: hypothetical protein NW206_20165 [Hyphomonadaceae bacterium]|nr:hypothetical protein [Hyphomonadaceae bacterium]